MMPNVKGADRTRLDILLYSLVLAPLGVAPCFIGFASLVYGVLSIGLWCGLHRLCSARSIVSAPAQRRINAPMRLFGFSILYLFLLFAEILSERVIALATGLAR